MTSKFVAEEGEFEFVRPNVVSKIDQDLFDFWSNPENQQAVKEDQDTLKAGEEEEVTENAVVYNDENDEDDVDPNIDEEGNYVDDEDEYDDYEDEDEDEEDYE